MQITDLYGENLLLMHRGWSHYVDELRDDLWQHHPQVNIVDFEFYSMDIFNRCENTNDVLLAIPGWANVHPLLKVIPVEWEHNIPYGILHSPEPTPTVRRFLDAALCQLYPGYLATYRRYVRALQQKNALLRHSAGGTERPWAEKCALLEVLNVELAAQGEAIQKRRREYLALLTPLACANYAELSHGAERMAMRYAAQFEPGGLSALLKQRQNEELRAGQSLCGIHREDVELLLDDQPAKVFASQGQQRSVVLSLKRAEAAAAARITGEHPVLLLDDVLSELDEGRKQYLLTRMKEKQTFVTSCDDTAFLKTDGEVYRMNGGVLSKA